MALSYPEKGGDNSKFLVPAGSHIGLCCMVVDLGIQPGSGQYPEPKPQVFISWELPFEIVEWEKDGVKHKGPRVISKTYTASMGKKANLRKDLEAWRGKTFADGEAAKFDISTILGKGCSINVVHKPGQEKTYANIVGISGVPKGTTLPGFSTKPLYCGPDDKTLYDDLPEWLRKKIDGQIIPEDKKVADANGVDFNPGFYNQEVTDDDSIPF